MKSSRYKLVRCDIVSIFGNENVTTFCDQVIGLYVTDKFLCPINITDLKINSSTTLYAKLVHSFGSERAVSCHTILKTNKQSCYSRDAINSRMCIALS